ncbi:MAG: hypothetical protein J4F39_09470 [Candidatus Latescibacteria bacterium]|nr:hypothetical protein [Candidatus Latescibacterota bacterium]
MGTGPELPGASEGVRSTTMQAAILGMLVVNVPLLLVSFGMGYASRFDWMSVSVSAHLKVGLLAAFLTVLTQTTTMFYFMGTGSAIKAEVRERGLDPEFLARARAFKGSFFYLLTLGILLIMAAAMIGGGAHADLLWSAGEGGRTFYQILHEALAILSLLVNMIAFALTPFYIRKNNRLLDDVGSTRATASE